MTVFDYLEYYNDLTFDDCPFNDVDNIVFSTLIYLPFKHIDFKKDMSINELSKYILAKSEIQNTSMSIKWLAIKMLDSIKNSNRYSKVIFSNYVSILDHETQFGAVTIRFNSDDCYIVFKGTDNSLTGWKEDLELSYKYPVIAQTLAAKYLKNTIKFNDKNVYVGGHSKGGNLAMASVMEADRKTYQKIKMVYNNDGPGFKKEQFDSLKYKRMAKKLKTIVPEDSLIGILLFGCDHYFVVKSNEMNIMQHHLTNWNCFGQFLVPGKLSKNSIKKKNQFNKFLLSTSDEDKKIMIDTLFDVLEKSGIKYFYEIKKIKFNEISAMIKEIKGIDEESKRIFIDVLKNLVF